MRKEGVCMQALVRWLYPVIVLAVAVFAFGGCGGEEQAPVATGTPAAAPGRPTKEPIVIGLLGYRTGPLANMGSAAGAALADLAEAINASGGINGHPLQIVEVETGYETAKFVDAYEQVKGRGAVALVSLSTPALAVIAPRCNADRIVCINANGFTDYAAGQGNPYVFLMVPWEMQTARAIDYIMKKAGSQRPLTIGILAGDSPIANEVERMAKALSERLGFQYKLVRVPITATDVKGQLVALRGSDWFIFNTYGALAGVSIQDAKAVGIPLERVVGLAGTGTASDLEPAGGLAATEGFQSVLYYNSFSNDTAVHRLIVQGLRAAGKQPSGAFNDNIGYYNLGLAYISPLIEALRNLTSQGQPVTGENVRKALEQLRGYDGGGLHLPWTGDPAIHDGGGATWVIQVRGGRWTKVDEFTAPYRDVFSEHVRAAGR
jgi:branched-chain amino acid transport system substrate-binding protein